MGPLRTAVAKAALAGLGVCLAIFPAGCLELPAAPEPPAAGPATAIAPGQSRDVVLYAIRLDVQGFEQEIGLADLLALPASVREDMWLYDLDLNGHDGSPRLLDNALSQIRDKDPYAAGLSVAERNMIRLLNMTPGDADLRGTRIEELLALGPKIGIPSAQVLADAMGILVDDPFVAHDALGKAVVAGVISSHPNARTRPGPKSAAHPDGRIPVPAGHLPVTLADVISKLTNLPDRFGPYDSNGVYHPGFVVGASEADVLRDGFKMIIKANANALPFKGVELSNGAIGSVPSIGKDGGSLFDFNDPEWLQIVGLTAKPAVTKMTFQMVEHPTWVKPGNSPVPAPWGNSPVWQAPSWAIERVIAEAAMAAYSTRDYSKAYHIGANPDPLFTVAINKGWMSMQTKGDIGTPPPPMYIWDLMSEVAQVRLHDGPDPLAPDQDKIPEGGANVRFALTDIEVGVTAEQITAMVRRNLERDASSLIGTAGHIIDQHAGAPDIFYYRPRASSADAGTDWLYFVHPEDIPDKGEGAGRKYARPGFFADAGLDQKLSTTAWVDGDERHEKVKISAGDVLFVADEAGVVYRVEVRAKPSPARIRLTITRVS